MTLIHLAGAWLLGIYLGSWLQVPAQVVVVAVLFVSACALVLRNQPRARLVALSLLCFCLGWWRFDLARPVLTPGPLAAYNGQDSLALRGLVVNEPIPRDRTADLHLSVRSLRTNGVWKPMTGRVLVRVQHFEDIRYGDELEVYGKLEAPTDFEGFSYRTYLARRGIHSLSRYPGITLLARDQGQPLWAFLYALKRRTQGVIAAILPEPEAALLTGILTGSDEGIPASLMDQFRATGTSHIIAISGFNITLISAALVQVLSRLLQRYVALVAAVAAIALYTLLVGAEAPVVRAAIMGGLTALALIAGRRSHALTSLFAAAWLMTAWQPFLLWDVGAQLSFAASLGLIAYSEELQRACENLLRKFVSLESAVRATQLLSDNLLSTIAAMIIALPVIIYHFEHFSPLYLLSNLLVLPVQPAVMYWGATAVLAGLAYLPLGRVLGWAAWLLLTYTIRTVEITSKWLDNSGAVGSVHPALLWAYGGILAWLTFRPQALQPALESGKRFLRQRATWKVTCALLILALILAWSAVARFPDGRLHVTFLDVGQGDAILIETPSGRRMLIDGGPSPATLLAALGRRLPFWDRRIDIVLLTHPHDDHVRGLLPLIDRYRVRQVLTGDVEHTSAVYRAWRESLQEQGIPVLGVGQPWQVDFGDGPTAEILPPLEGNSDSLDETSLVVRLTWQEAIFLFTGDLEADGLLELHRAGWPLACTVLKVPHHGSDEAVSAELLAVTSPDLAVISVGADNRFGHPANETLSCLDQANVQVLRTDQSGTVQVVTDGDSYWVRTTNTY